MNAASGVTVVEGPSFPLGLRVLATATMVWLALFALRTLPQRAEVAMSWQVVVGLLALAAIVLGSYLSIMLSRTRLDDTVIRQRWLFVREVGLHEITQIKLVQVPGLNWLVVPRLVVRTRGLRVQAFYVGHPPLLQAARSLVERGTQRGR